MLDILILKPLRDHRHLLVMPVAGSERFQLALQIDVALAADMRNIRPFGDAVDAVAAGALPGHLASDRNITANRNTGGHHTEKTGIAKNCGR